MEQALYLTLIVSYVQVNKAAPTLYTANFLAVPSEKIIDRYSLYGLNDPAKHRQRVQRKSYASI